jgi:NifU-like protein involved in Fe-S cluster formation
MSRYSATVGEYFPRPVRPGGTDLRGEAGSERAGTQISVAADLAGERLQNVGFRVFGCPHIIALAHRAAELLEGAPVGLLRDLPLEELAQEFDLPVEKTGKLLIMKDALTACFALSESGTADAATHQVPE